MLKKIILCNSIIEYELRVSTRARQGRVIIYPGGKIKVTVPYGVQEAAIERFMMSKAEWIVKKLQFQKNILPRTSLKTNSADFKIYKQQAHALVVQKLEYFNTYYNFSYHKVSIRNQTTRWGSCSRTGNLNFNYRIYLLPDEVANYLIVHELCHLKHLNHSAAFWSAVAQTIPDYKTLRKKLKTIQL
jgi:predicted metal-dependent hydrolase